MSTGIPAILWPAFRGRRSAFMAGGILSLVVCLWTVVAAIQVAVEGYDGGVYVSQTDCPDGMVDQAGCVRRHQSKELERRTEDAVRLRLMMATVPLGLMVLFAVLWWRVRNENAPAVTRQLLAAPGDVVWVYTLQTRYMKHGRELARDAHLTICTVRSQIVSLKMSEPDVRRAIDALQAHLPHATFGFSPENQARFQRDPRSLLRAGPPAGAPAATQGAASPMQAPSPGPARPPWFAVAPHVPFPQIDHALRSVGLVLESAGPLVAPDEPSGAAWSAPWARVIYRGDPATRTRALELHAQDVPGLHARLASTGLPISGPQPSP